MNGNFTYTIRKNGNFHLQSFHIFLATSNLYNMLQYRHCYTATLLFMLCVFMGKSKLHFTKKKPNKLNHSENKCNSTGSFALKTN